MSNPHRVMARMAHVDSVEPIEGADRIMAARVGGWTVVVGKDDFQAGDLAVFFEVDSFLPADDPRYEKFAERGVKDMIVDGAAKKGHVLRTARLRGTYSQGLLMRPQDVLPSSIPEYAYEKMAENRVNLTKLCGVCEYEPIRTIDQGNMHILRKYDSWVAPRTDAERLQNVSEDVFNAIKKADYFASVKVDGTSLTMLYDPRYQKVRVFSHNNELSTEEGFGGQVYDYAKEHDFVWFMEEHKGVTIQCEGCGPKINGNRLGLKGMKLFVFSLWDTSECKYLDPYRFNDGELDCACTPILPGFDLSEFETTIDLINWVDGLRGKVVKDRLDEGIVIHIIGRGDTTDDEWRMLQNELGAQMQVKCISAKYLLKAKG